MVTPSKIPHLNIHTKTLRPLSIQIIPTLNTLFTYSQSSFTMFHRRRPATTTTRSSKPSLMTRLRGPNAKSKTVKTKTTTTRHGPSTHHGHSTHHGPSAHNTTSRRWGVSRPQHHHRRKVTFGDKVSGAMLKLKGSLTHRPGVKVCL